MEINRVWAMPNKWTFTIKPIHKLLDRYVNSGVGWVDPYCGQNSPAELTNDLIEKADFNMDALDFLKTRKDEEFKGVLLDPPYSLRQVSEHYKKAGVKITGWHTSAGYNSALKNEAMRIIKPNGLCICFGWNSMGLGKNRGFELIEILLVPHGGSKNDTLITVERKVQHKLRDVKGSEVEG